MKKSGFTLAEVLITLGIIGVVAAMTIPALINQTNNADIKAAVKKGLSALNQAVLMSVAIDGNDFSQLVSSNAAPGVAGTLNSLFVNRMNVASSTYGSVTSFGAVGPFANATNYTFFFNDGIAITFPGANGGTTGCTSNSYSAGSTTAGHCNLVIDVNGAKGPNMLSTATNSTIGIKDQFTFLFYNTSVLPATKAAQYILYN